MAKLRRVLLTFFSAITTRCKSPRVSKGDMLNVGLIDARYIEQSPTTQR